MPQRPIAWIFLHLRCQAILQKALSAASSSW